MSAYSEESTFEKAFSNNRLGRNSLLQMKCFLFVGANTAGTKQQLRMHKTIQLNPHKPSWQTGSMYISAWGKFVGGEKCFLQTRQPDGSKNLILCFFQENMRYIRIHNRGDTHRCIHG